MSSSSLPISTNRRARSRSAGMPKGGELTTVFDLNAAEPLVIYKDGEAQPVALEKALGYQLEIEYFLKCVAEILLTDVGS